MQYLKKPILYGIVIAIAGSIIMISLVWLGLLGPKGIQNDREMIGGTILFLMIYLLLLVGIYFVLQNEKTSNHNLLSFRRAMVIGLVTSISTAICSVILTVLFYESLYPTYVGEVLEALQNKMQLLGINGEQIEQKLFEKRAYYSTSNQCIFSFTGNLITGTAFTLLLAFFLKNQNR